LRRRNKHARMQQRFLGFDHVDTRVKRLKDVEKFYMRLLPALGLSKIRHAHVDEHGEWDDDTSKPYNVVEFYEDVSGAVPFFIGIIEDPAMRPIATRVAFRVDSKDDLPRWAEFLQTIGAVNIESGSSDDYPAIFFEDACGTKLELCARFPSPN